MVEREFGGDLENGLEVVHGLREALPFGSHAVSVQELGDLCHYGPVGPMGADAVEPGGGDHLDVLLERPFDAVGMAALHRQSDCSTNSLCSSCADTFSPPALILLRTVPARAQP